jgi:hypothetical protein
MNSKWIRYVFFSISSLLPLSHGHAQGDDSIRSMHLGLLYPNGVDVAGYSVEKRISADLYRFYTFGFPSLAAVGLSYYMNYGGDGLTSTVGVGIGSVLYGSVAYQWQTDKSCYWKLGAGVTAGVAYSGVYPVLSYEYRFDN